MPAVTALPRARRALQALLLAALAAAAFLPVVRNEFINFDDDRFIYENPQVRRGLTPATALWALRATENANWYPLTRLSHLADASLFGMRAGGHHLASLAWHAASALLLLAALRLMTGAAWRSFLTAALFAAHPLQAESVSWAAERSNVLAGFFFALALLLRARHARRPGPGRYAAALAAFALGLASKPVLVTLPCLLLLLEFWPLGRLAGPGEPPWRIDPGRLGRRVAELAPWFALSAAASAVTLLTQEEAGALTAFGRLSPAVRLGNAALAYAGYLGKIVWPAGLAVYYPHAVHDFPAARAAAAGALLAALTALAFALRRRRPWLIVGWLWFLGVLVPMIGIVQVGTQSLADRYAYLPLVGIAVAAVWLAADSLAALPRSRTAAAPLAAVAIAALAATSLGQARLWKDSETLYAHALEVTSGNWLVEINLGQALKSRGRLEEAAGHFRAALRIGPGLVAAHAGLADTLMLMHRPGEAVEHYRELLRLRPDFGPGHFGLAAALLDDGRPAEALAAAREAVRLDPGDAAAHDALGSALFELGRTAESVGQFREALRLAPGDPSIHGNLGNALRASGRPAEAEGHAREAVRLRPGDAVAHSNLGNALFDLGQLGEAEDHYREALRLNPSMATAHSNLCFLLLRLRRHPEAEEQCREALRLDRDSPDAHENLASVLLAGGRGEEAAAHSREAVRLRGGRRAGAAP
jgi:tetratricopeptide (TPR) repeat protein